MFNTIFFDLDGTLLPMDQDRFIRKYFEELSLFFKQEFPDSKKFLSALNYSVNQMLENDGTKTNCERFWQEFEKLLPDIRTMEDKFLLFYQTKFDNIKINTSLNPLVPKIVKVLKEKGYRLILTTNPIFPLVATQKRIAWAGLDYDDFSFVTTYENSYYSKPKLAYFQVILDIFDLKAKNVMIVGNDTKDDMSVLSYGFDSYLITDCLIDEYNLPKPKKNGSMEDFWQYVLTLPVLNNN